MSRLHHWAAAAMAAALLASTSSASAQPRGPWQPKSQGHRLGGDFDMWSTRNFTLMSWAFVGQIEVTDHVMIDFNVPWAYGNFDIVNTTQSAFVFGNPAAGAHYGTKVAPNVALWVGGLLTFPTIFDPDFEPLVVSYLAAVSRGFFDADRFLLEHLTIRPRAGVELRAGGIFFYRADLGLPLFIPVDDDQETEFFVEIGNEVELRAPIGLGGGVRFQGVIASTETPSATGPQNDLFQAAIEPYFTYEPIDDSGFFARAGLLVALDTPLGFGFDRGGTLAALKVSMGGKF